MAAVVLYGGKGGVGKTTCAAATGLGLAAAGHETLVVSTDPAHSLADAFDEPVDSQPTEVGDGVAAVEVDPARETDRYEALFETLADDLHGVGVDLDDEGLAELFSSGLLPGTDQLAALATLDTYADDDRWDRVVFDTAPTGHTLRLLDLPEAVGTGVQTALSLRDQVTRKADAAKTMLFGPYAAMGDDDEAAAFTDLLAEMERVGDLLRDPSRSVFRVVTQAEPMVVAETDRLVGELREAGVPLGPLVVNRVLESPTEGCARCEAQYETQQSIIDDLDTRFPDLDRRIVPDLTGQAGGRAALAQVADRLVAD